jgi:PAS domain S-box-containing protein
MPTPPVLNPDDYRVLVEQAPIMIWRAGTDAKCDFFNERWLAFTGRTMSQELGDGWAEGVHPDDLERCVSVYLEAFEASRPFEMEYRLRRFDGSFRWIFDRGVPIFHGAGVFAGFTGSCIDITEAYEAREEKRRRRDEELTTLRGMLPICSWCKQVRNDEGYWQAVEVYVRDHAAVDFSHGICPTCEASLTRQEGGGQESGPV